MGSIYQHSPNAAGEALLKFCTQARRQLRARFTKPADTDDEAAWSVYVENLVRIRRMDHNELHAALARPEIGLDHWDELGHFYAPIAFYNGAILKYQGIATKGNEAHLREQHPAGVTLETFRGDRIRAEDFSVV